MQLFQSTPPARGATVPSFFISPRPPDFNPRPPRGGRRHGRYPMEYGFFISIHAPREGGDERPAGQHGRRGISIHAPREGGDAWRSSRGGGHYISIHAPREGGDARTHGKPQALVNISIHAPREGGDTTWTSSEDLPAQFQSTPPARGATEVGNFGGGAHRISIHAPREGGDRKDAQFYLRIFDK